MEKRMIKLNDAMLAYMKRMGYKNLILFTICSHT